ncbi:MAG: CAP-associated domain-containing protein, partial [Enterococcus sp.]
MKRRLIFWLLLFVAIAVVYLQPVFFPRQAPAYDSQTNKDVSQTSLKYKPIKVSGYAEFIGKSSSELTNILGKPLVSYDSGFGYRVNTYQSEDKTNYIAANIRNGKVAAVKVAGNDDQHTAPFKSKMTMNDLTNVTMLYPNFSLDYNGEKIQFELMEEDMNYRPLVAFTNDTFAILFFNQKKSQLVGITYLDKQMLLELAPYTSIEGQLPQVRKTQLTDWDEVNRLKETSSFDLLNVLRKLENREAYTTNFTLQGRADDINVDFLKEPQKYLNEERFKQFERMKDVANPQPFLIVS